MNSIFLRKDDVGFVSAALVTSDIRDYDRESKLLLCQKPVLANLLKAVVDEFTQLPVNDIMELLDVADISGDTEVSPSRTNAMVRGENTEFAELGEAMSVFDTLIKIKNPVLSDRSLRRRSMSARLRGRAIMTGSCRA